MWWVRFGVLLSATASLHAASGRLGSDSVSLDSPLVIGPLEGACPGALERRVPPNGEHADWTCNACPEVTGSKHDWWTLESVIFGHFSAPDSEDAILSTYGCVAHAAGPMGGSFLVTRRKGGDWQLVHYAMTLLTWECRKIRMSDRRDALVCENGDGHQGMGETWYERVTAERGKLDSQEIFLLKNSITSCFSPAIDQSADEFDLRATGKGRYELLVTVRSGTKVLGAEDLRRCHSGEVLNIPTTRFQLIFRFDGRSWWPVPETAAALAKIRSIQPPEF